MSDALTKGATAASRMGNLQKCWAVLAAAGVVELHKGTALPPELAALSAVVYPIVDPTLNVLGNIFPNLASARIDDYTTAPCQSREARCREGGTEEKPGPLSADDIDGADVTAEVMGSVSRKKLKANRGVGSLRPVGYKAVEAIGKIRDNRSEVDMSVEQAILEAVRTLPFDKQQEILSHATRLRDEAASKMPFQSIKGILASRGISVSAEDIDQARRELWKNFPREDI